MHQGLINDSQEKSMYPVIILREASKCMLQKHLQNEINKEDKLEVIFHAQN